MFESLSEKLQGAFQRLRTKGALTEQDVADTLREVRLVLLEADVNLQVVKTFVSRIKERAVGEVVLDGLNPAQQVVKIVDEELTLLLGGETVPLQFSSKTPTVIMLCGLQGAGKTTHAGKLAQMLRKQGRNPLLVAADIYRPAAIKQLQVVGEQVKTPVFVLPDTMDAARICREGVSEARRAGHDVVIIDSAGRLQIDVALMDELRNIQSAVSPTEVLLVVDAMTGQEAVNVATGFNDALGITGFILTKLDGDTRGGAALSIKSVLGKPIKFVGVGEKMDAIETFHPDRMASRILGMGDVLSLIERAEQAIDQKQAEQLEKKLRANKFDLEDFLEQMKQVKKLGKLSDIIGMIPGLSGANIPKIDVSEKQTAHVEAIIYSMTVFERRNPNLINGSRRRRIAMGSGRTVQEVNQLLTRFDQARQMMRSLTGGPQGMMGIPNSRGKHAGSNKQNKRKPPPQFRFPGGR